MHNERVQEVHGGYINSFSKKNSHIGQVGHFGPENGVTWIYSEDFFEILHSKRCKEVHEDYFISFSEIFWANGPFWAQKWCNIIILVPLKNYFSLAQ